MFADYIVFLLCVCVLLFSDSSELRRCVPGASVVLVPLSAAAAAAQGGGNATTSWLVDGRRGAEGTSITPLITELFVSLQ